MGIHATVWMSSGIAVYAIIRRWPGVWWLVTGAVFLFITIAITYLGPRFVFRGCNSFDRLSARPFGIGSMLSRVGPAHRSLRSSSGVSGMASFGQVLLTEMLLADCSDDEIEVVVAHELAHYHHRDIWQTIALERVVFTLADGAADLAMSRVTPMLGLSGVRDVAGLPVRSSRGWRGATDGSGAELAIAKA